MASKKSEMNLLIVFDEDDRIDCLIDANDPEEELDFYSLYQTSWESGECPICKDSNNVSYIPNTSQSQKCWTCGATELMNLDELIKLKLKYIEEKEKELEHPPFIDERGVKVERCKSCEAAMINGILCHEQGCPDAWKSYTRECKWCGTKFMPQWEQQDTCSKGCFESLWE